MKKMKLQIYILGSLFTVAALGGVSYLLLSPSEEVSQVETVSSFSSFLENSSAPQQKNKIQFKEKSAAKNQRETVLGKVEVSARPEKEDKVILNDPSISQAWGLSKSNAQKAWELSTGDRRIVVAVIDTGVDVRHEDLASNLWTNPGETGLDAQGRDKANNGIDDDGNGFVDDVHGWNFVSNTKDLTDNHGHGTHIEGIIGAAAGNGKGIAGVAPRVSMMTLKYYDPKAPNTDNLRNTINAIRYAIRMKADIINYSGGGTEFSQDEKNAIEEARKQGILFVAAAGNERSNSDKFKYYPADYGLSNIISVTAIDPRTEVLSSSNYGTETVDLAAPGQNILSTLPGNQYGPMTGTSQATAFVTGAAVLIKAHKKYNNPEDIKKYILSTGDNLASLSMKTKTSRKLNLYKSLAMIDQNTTLGGGKDATASNITFPSDQKEFQLESQRKLANFRENTQEVHTQSVAMFGKSILKNLQKKGPAPAADSNNSTLPQQ